ncbi:MAG: hypothetical protein QM669_03665 [Siphonobacter sp.]
MKTIVTSLFVLLSTYGFGQVLVTPIEQEISKVKRIGYVTSTTVNEKVAEDTWKSKLAQYGRVTTERNGVYKVDYATVPFYPSGKVAIVSQVSTKRGKTDVFVSMDMGNGEYMTSTNLYGRELENVLRDFHEQADYNAQVKQADDAYQDVADKHKDLVKKTDRNVRNLKDNRSEKVRLLKRLQENEKELLELQKDSTQLGTDMIKSLQAVEDQKKNVERVKERKP